MHPVLLHIGGFTLDTYSVVWLIALLLAIRWMTRRFALYGVDDEEARRVVFWSFLAMLLGASLFKPLWHIRFFAAHPSLILTQGGLSEVGAVVGAFAAAFWLCRHNPKLSFQKLCDVASLPAFFTIAVGRWGCFLNGCCVGIESGFPLALHFPQDPVGVTRHPTQLYYSAASAAILAVLFTLERSLLRRRPVAQEAGPHRAVIAPLALILYTLMRLFIDVLRAPSDDLLPLFNIEIAPNLLILAAALPFEGLWLARSLRESSGGKVP